MVYYGSDNNVYELTKQLGAGAEGVVYNIKGHNNIVAKILKASDPQVLLKVRLMSHMDWNLLQITLRFRWLHSMIMRILRANAKALS